MANNITEPSGGALVKQDQATDLQKQLDLKKQQISQAKSLGYGNTTPLNISGAGNVLPTSTTTISNGNKISQMPDIIKKAESYGITGLTSGADGTIRYANGDIYYQPQSETQTNEPAPITTPTAGTYIDYSGNTKAIPTGTVIPAGVTLTPDGSGDYVGSNGLKYSHTDLADASYDQEQIKKNNETIKAGADAAMADAINAINKNYDLFIQQQQEINKGQEAGVQNALLMGGVTGGGGSAQFAPISSQGMMTAQIKYGQQQIIKLQNERDSLISQAKLVDYSSAGGGKALQTINEQLQKNVDAQMAEAKKLNDKIAEQNQKMADQIIQSSRDSAIADLYSQGITDVSSLLDTLNYDEQGNLIGDFTAKEVADTLKNIVPVGLNDLITTLRNNGAPSDIISKVMSSPTLSDAYKIAGSYAAGGTGKVGEYNFYKANTESKGLTPLSYSEWIDEENKKAIQQKSAESYASAYASASGKAAADMANGVDSNGNITTPQSVDPDSQSILSQTGLSIMAFNYLTQGTSALTRMTAKERIKYMSEAQDWLNKKGIDISTFQSQYKAYNDVLAKNINRLNSTKIMENELDGTLSNLGTVADSAELGKLNYANVLKIWAGKEVNDPIAQKYSFHLQQLKNELAAYFAASQGKNSPDVVDNADAEKAIKDGISKKTIDGLKEAVSASTEKMSVVMQNSVDSTRKAVWDLFGVSDKFKPQEQTISDTQAKSKIDEYIKNNPQDADKIAQMYDVEGATDIEIYNNLKSRGIIK